MEQGKGQGPENTWILHSSENLLGVMPWFHVGMGLRRSLIGLSIGSFTLKIFPYADLNKRRCPPGGTQCGCQRASSCAWPSPSGSAWTCAHTQCNHHTYTGNCNQI